MAERPFGNFSQWPLKELIEKERSFTVGDKRGSELKAEIERRRAASGDRYTKAGAILAAISAVAAIVAAVASLLTLHGK